MADWSDIEHAAGDTDYIAHLNTQVARAESVATEVEALALVVGSPGSPGDLPVTGFGVGTLTGGQLLRANATASALEGVSWGRTQTLTGATTLGGADAGTVVHMTGAWALGFAAAATLGAGWSVDLLNAGSGIITVDPDGSELITASVALRCIPASGGGCGAPGPRWSVSWCVRSSPSSSAATPS